MNGSGRNWTRRSIEELVDEFLKKKGGKPSANPEYGFVYRDTTAYEFSARYDAMMGEGPAGASGHINWDLTTHFDPGVSGHSDPLVFESTIGERTALWDKSNTISGPRTNYFYVLREDYMSIDNLSDCLVTIDDPANVMYPDHIECVQGFQQIRDWYGHRHPYWHWAYSFNRGEPASDMIKTQVSSNQTLWNNYYHINIPDNLGYDIWVEIAYLSAEDAALIDSYWNDMDTILFVSGVGEGGELTTENIMQLRSNLFDADAH